MMGSSSWQENERLKQTVTTYKNMKGPMVKPHPRWSLEGETLFASEPKNAGGGPMYEVDSADNHATAEPLRSASPRLETAPQLGELILYVLGRCRRKSFFGDTALNEILYFTDFINFATTGRSITGVPYLKEKYGPAPDPATLRTARNQLIRDGRLNIQVDSCCGLSQTVSLATDRADCSVFDRSELHLVDYILFQFCRYAGDEIAGITKMDLGWQMSDFGKSIPYYTVWIRRRNLLTSCALERAHDRARRAGRGRQQDAAALGPVALSHSFNSNLRRLQKVFPRLPDILEDVVHVLSRGPEQFNCVDKQNGIWGLRTDEGPWEKTPAFDFVYHVGDQPGPVMLLSVEAAQ